MFDTESDADRKKRHEALVTRFVRLGLPPALVPRIVHLLGEEYDQGYGDAVRRNG